MSRQDQFVHALSDLNNLYSDILLGERIALMQQFIVRLEQSHGINHTATAHDEHACI